MRIHSEQEEDCRRLCVRLVCVCVCFFSDSFTCGSFGGGKVLGISAASSSSSPSSSQPPFPFVLPLSGSRLSFQQPAERQKKRRSVSASLSNTQWTNSCSCFVPSWSRSCWWPGRGCLWMSGSWFLSSPHLLGLTWQTAGGMKRKHAFNRVEIPFPSLMTTQSKRMHSHTFQSVVFHALERFDCQILW